MPNFILNIISYKHILSSLYVELICDNRENRKEKTHNSGNTLYNVLLIHFI